MARRVTVIACSAVMQPQPMVVLADVEAGSRWFQAVLRLASAHGGPEYEMLMDGETLVAQLHQWGQREVWLRGPEGYVVVVAGPRS